MLSSWGCIVDAAVALLAEGVDRNYQNKEGREARTGVALLAEGVDRNYPDCKAGKKYQVALLAEGVDRNASCKYLSASSAGRPPRGGRG